MNWYNSFIWKTLLKQPISSIYNVKMAYSFYCDMHTIYPSYLIHPGANCMHIKSAVTLFFSIISCLDMAMPNRQGLRSYVQILGWFRKKMLPPQWIEFFG